LNDEAGKYVALLVISSKLLDQLCITVTGVRLCGALGRAIYSVFQNVFSHPVSYIVLQCTIFIRLQYKNFLDGLKTTFFTRIFFFFLYVYMDTIQGYINLDPNKTDTFIFISC
jgi:hypothetical protein